MNADKLDSKKAVEDCGFAQGCHVYMVPGIFLQRKKDRTDFKVVNSYLRCLEVSVRGGLQGILAGLQGYLTMIGLNFWRLQKQFR